MTWQNKLIKTFKSDSPVVEFTPVIWHGRLMMVETWQSHWDQPGILQEQIEHSLRIRDEQTNEILFKGFENFGFCSAFVWNDMLYVYITRMPYALTSQYPSQSIYVSCTKNLRNWSEPIMAIKCTNGEQLFNESVCSNSAGFVMAYESSQYVPFTLKFATSDDLIHWQTIPDAVFGQDRYVACPAIRFCRGYYYMLYVEYRRPRWLFETYLTRSKDLMSWENTSHNPVIAPDPQGKVHPHCDKHGDPAKSMDYYGVASEPTCILNDRREHCPAMGKECNASDPDLVEWQGKTMVYFTGGCQHWGGLLQYAEFDGLMGDFFEYYY